MSNHYHLAIRTGSVPLARTVGFVQARFGQGHNRRWRSSGPLWQSRYRARRLEDQREVLQLIAYVHLNPVAARVVDDPAGYPYSGHRELLGRTPPRLVDVERVLALYGETVGRARRSYLSTLRKARQAEWVGAAPGRLPWWGDDADRPLPAPAPMLDPLGRSPGRSRRKLPVVEFVQRSCERLGIDIERVVGSGQDREVSRARYLIASLAVERWRIRTKDLAAFFGRRADVVTRWARLGAEIRRSDNHAREAYEAVDELLSADAGAGPSTS